jgi:hypothetical protein
MRSSRSGHLLRRQAAIALVVVGLVASACSSDGDGSTSDGPTTTAASADGRPDGPAADLEVIDAPGAPFLGAAADAGLPEGYVEEEYVASGTATDYAPVGELDPSGEWTFEPGTSAEYRTRVVVRHPLDVEAFSGTVVVEWLNVSGGLDANPDWASLSEEIGRQGHAWVGVSAQLIGVEGGPMLVTPPVGADIVGKGLKGIDPERYGTLEHPGDGYAFDIYTQVARAVRAGSQLTARVVPDVVLAAGESQSALALTTYYNGVQPLTEAFDGFFVHSRAFVALPLVGPGEYADLAGGMASATEGVLLRGDLDAPVLQLQAEGDVIGVLSSVDVRQDDSDVLRLWEVAGTAHADAHLLGDVADALECGVEINDGPLHLVAKAGLRALDAWVRDGTAPPTAPRLQVTEGDEPAIARDEVGIALGGIRTPPVDVPVVALSGDPGPDGGLICVLMGSTRPLTVPELSARYDDATDYEAQYARAVDEVVASGFVLADDREALLGYADPSRLP